MEILAETQARIDLCRTAIAIERYRRANNKLPGELAALQNQFLKEAPKDVIGGGDLRYSIETENRYRLWSIGWNQQDDGGQPSTNRFEGDWVWFSHPQE